MSYILPYELNYHFPSFSFRILFVWDPTVIFKIGDIQMFSTALISCLFDSPFESTNWKREMVITIFMSEFLYVMCGHSRSQLHYHSLSNSALSYRCLRSRNTTASLTWDVVKVSLSVRECWFPSHYKQTQAFVVYAPSSVLAQTLGTAESPPNCLMLSKTVFHHSSLAWNIPKQHSREFPIRKFPSLILTSEASTALQTVAIFAFSLSFRFSQWANLIPSPTPAPFPNPYSQSS